MTQALEPEAFRFRFADFPPLTGALPGTGGVIRTVPEDFVVRELPLYLPSGQGSHSYALIRKRGLSTRDVVLALTKFGVPEGEIGVAGLKDKHALSEQWLSVPNRYAAVWAELDGLEGVTVLDVSRHRNKLGVGHLLGNRFTVRIRQVGPDALVRAQAVIAELTARGVPNYFGPQRFGRFGGNAIDGLKVLRGEAVPGGHRLKRFFVSALQSLIFNHLLRLRLQRGLYACVLAGERAKRHDSGGLFVVEDPLLENPRARRLEISAALPLYGKKVRPSRGEAGELEREVLATFGLHWHDFAQRRGAYRSSRVVLQAVELDQDDGLQVSFTLAKGAYATSVLREIMKVDPDGAEGLDENEEL
jgi:tRNA pseudouridine13 synthase